MSAVSQKHQRYDKLLKEWLEKLEIPAD